MPAAHERWIDGGPRVRRGQHRTTPVESTAEQEAAGLRRQRCRRGRARRDRANGHWLRLRSRLSMLRGLPVVLPAVVPVTVLVMLRREPLLARGDLPDGMLFR